MAKEIRKFNKKEDNGDIIPCYEIICSVCGLKTIIPTELLDAFSGMCCNYCRHSFNLEG